MTNVVQAERPEPIMTIFLYLASAVAVLATLLMVTRLNAVHALLYLVVSLLAVAVVFFLLGAPFAAALEIIIYAGAIMVLFIFVVMMMNLGPQGVAQERQWYRPSLWLGPGLLALALLGEFVYVLSSTPSAAIAGEVSPQTVGLQLMTRYGLGVELASFVLLSGLIGAFHIGRRQRDWARDEETR